MRPIGEYSSASVCIIPKYNTRYRYRVTRGAENKEEKNVKILSFLATTERRFYLLYGTLWPFLHCVLVVYIYIILYNAIFVYIYIRILHRWYILYR